MEGVLARLHAPTMRVLVKASLITRTQILLGIATNRGKYPHSRTTPFAKIAGNRFARVFAQRGSLHLAR
jgi:hypothetical protein